MSESETQRRIVAARLLKRIPALYGYLESGRITLSTLVRIKDHVTEDNAEELVAAVSGLTRDNVDKVLASRAPRPDVPATLRKLPTQSAAPTSSSSMRTEKLEALSESRYRLQLTASEALRDKLERARALMRHRNPSGDLALIVEAAMDLLVAQLEKERLGATKKPQKPRRPAAKRSRYVPTATRRAVFERDGEQCTFANEEKERCNARTLLEIDHVGSYGLGGSNDVKNLRVRCKAHNKLHAEATYGREHIERQMDSRRGKLGKAPTPKTCRAPEEDTGGCARQTRRAANAARGEVCDDAATTATLV